MIGYYKIGDIIDLLGVGYWKVYHLIRARRIQPYKDSSGDYVFSEGDLKRLKEILRIEDKEEVPILGR